MRQTRLREEARARMAAKFGNKGMGGVGSSASGSGGGFGSASSYSPARPNTVSAPSSGNMPSSFNPTGIKSAPVSGNAPRTAPAPKKELNSNDFFSSFGA